jgi:hypothetical protein
LTKTSTSVIFGSRSPPGGSALCIVHPTTIARGRSRAGLSGCPVGRKPDRQAAGLLPRSKTNSETCVTIRIRRRTPIDSGSASKAPLRPLSEIPEMPQNQRAAPRSALSLLSLFMRQCPAIARAGRSRSFNGLRGFAERRGERDPICRSAGQNLCGEPLVSLENPGGCVGEHLAAQHDVGIRRVLGEMMRDAADRRHEHHGRWQALGQDLRIVAGA